MLWLHHLFLQAQGHEDIISDIVVFAGFIIVILAISFLIFFVFSRRRQNQLVIKQKIMQEEFDKQLMLAQIEVQEYTAAALGQELHDNIGQLLSSTKILISLSERSMPTVPDTSHVAEETLAKAIQDLRSLAKSLNKEWLRQFNLVENLEMEKARINASCAIGLSLSYEHARLPVQPETQIMLFRIIQEAIQNCLRHAGAKKIDIRIVINGSELGVLIADDGKGFLEQEKKFDGVGIMNMRHRTKLIGGNINWETSPYGGTQVNIHLPIQQKEL
jgi:signal transduction histidine kinase